MKQTMETASINFEPKNLEFWKMVKKLGNRNPDGMTDSIDPITVYKEFENILALRDQELLEKIEGMKKEIELDGEGEPYTAGLAYNCALTDVSEVVKSL